MEQFKQLFIEESAELLETFEKSVLDLEDNPNDSTLIDTLFRAVHTIKGSSNMFGFNKLGDFVHHLEDVYERLRHGDLEFNQELTALSLASLDIIQSYLNNDDIIDSASAQKVEEVLSQVQTLIKKSDEPKDSDEDEAQSSQPRPETNLYVQEGESLSLYRITLKPSSQFLISGNKPPALVESLISLGELTSVPHVSDVPDLASLDPAHCYIHWEFYLTSKAGRKAIEDVFEFTSASAEVKIETLYDDVNSIEREDMLLGLLLKERGTVSETVINEALLGQKKIGEVLSEKGVSSSEIRSALGEQQHVKKVQQKLMGEVAQNHIRVTTEKLDMLVDLVGELVTNQARLSQLISLSENSDLEPVVEGHERLLGELRDTVMSVRMVPFGTSLARYRRLVRDLGVELKKDAQLVLLGSETELDKTVLDRLQEPLVHLIRNSMDHGLEDKLERKRQGKNQLGTITVKAQHNGGNVLISVSDDGKGLDREKIRTKAISAGILSSDSDLSEQEELNLIFHPGLSTKDKVTSLSGRGVGMDAVKKQVESLGGGVSVRSELGQGTTIDIEIPLTLAIIDGLLVRSADMHFVIPLSSVQECVEYQRTNQRVERPIIEHRGYYIPCIRMIDAFRLKADPRTLEQAIIVQGFEKHYGLIVDEVIGGHQTVIKDLGLMFRDQSNGFSGATILGDGSIAYVLDVQRTIEMAGIV